MNSFDQHEADQHRKKLAELQDQYRQAIQDDKPFSEVRKIYEDLKKSKNELRDISGKDNAFTP
jgi:phosphoglycolate phosphatase-like HAD superfamily hydrolase